MPTLAQLSANAAATMQQEKPIRIGKLSFYPGQLVVVGSRPAMGRTTYLLYLLQQIMEQQPEAGALFFSNEEAAEKVFQKLVCQVSGVRYSELGTTMPDFLSDNSTLNSRNVWIEFANQSLETTIAQLDKKIEEHAIKYLFIDKLQELDIPSFAGENSPDITSVIVQLKQLAIKHQLVVFCTCSLTRETEFREGKMPMFCDLGYSDAIEDVSDIVLLLHRPYFYGISEDENGNDLTYVAEMFVPKNRNGFTGIIRYWFDDRIAQFSTYTGKITD